MDVPVSTYSQHESGERGFKHRAEQYATFFLTTPEWLLYGREATAEAGRPSAVPLVGYVGAGSQAYFFAKREEGRQKVATPNIAGAATRAIEVRTEDGLGALFESWLAFYNDDERGPVTKRHIGQLCIIGLHDGRTLVRRVQASKAPGFYHLIAPQAEPIFDIRVEWAARITGMSPR